MKVAMLYGAKDIRVSTAPDPRAPGPSEVLIDISYCGVCGSDLHKWQGHIMSDRAGPIKLPKNLGHEYSGIVADIGNKVTRCKVGDRVAINPYIFCGKCFYCRNGVANFCRDRTDFTEGWAELSLVHESAVYKLPEEISLEVATLAEPLAACLHSIGLANMRSGSTAVILGGGTIGLMILALARYSGAAKVIVSEPIKSRRDVALQMGADLTVDPREGDLGQFVRDATDGIGADVAFDCVTTSRTFRQSMDSVRLGGSIIVVGNADPEDRLPTSPMEIHKRGLIIKGSASRGYEFDHTMRWLSKLDFAPMITHTMPMEALNEAMAKLTGGEGVKILLTI